VAVSASFLFGILLDMLLKKLTGSEKIGYVAGSAAGGFPRFFWGRDRKAPACDTRGLFLRKFRFLLCIIYSHTVPDYVPVLILMTGLLEVEFAPALLGLVLVPLPFVVAALVKEGSIGGGDIKLMGACGFVLGVKRGYIALMLGLFLAVLFQTAYAKKEDKGFAMAPYLALGCLLAMLPA